MRHQLEPLAAARALIDEPAVSSRCALPHLIEAWCSAAECGTDELVSRLRAGAVASIPSSRRAAVIEVVEHALEATRAEPWAAVALPSRRTLRRCVGVLERATADRSRLPWAPVAAIAGALVLVLGMHCAAQRTVDRAGLWRAAYYGNPGFAGPPLEREVDTPSAEPPVAAPYSARFTTCLELEAPVDAVFQLVGAGGATLYVDDRAVVGDWSGGSEVRTRGGRIALTAGRHAVRLDRYAPQVDDQVAVLASLDGSAPAPLRTVAPCAEAMP